MVPVRSSEEGLDLVQRVRFDVVFCSTHLTGLNWVEFFDRVRGRVSAFALLAEAFSQDLSTHFRGEGRYVLQKPIEQSQFDRTLAAIEGRLIAVEDRTPEARIVLMLLRLGLIVLFCFSAAPAEKYSGPRPAKPDLPYLVHADALIETEVIEAKEEKKKDDLTYVVAGVSSPVKTPLTRPVFIFEAKEAAGGPDPGSYKFDVKNGRRQVLYSHKGKVSARPRRINVNPVGGDLFKIEVDESLENGEYAFTPEGSNQVFCFQVY